jgi:hypothetical protein
VCIENNIQQGTQGTEENVQSQEEGEDDEDSEEIQEEEVALRRSSRQPQPSTRLKNFITYSVQYPIQVYISYNNITQDHYVFLNTLSKEEEPTNYEITRLEPKWCKAMDEVLRALEQKNQTWEVCYLSKNKKSVGCR